MSEAPATVATPTPMSSLDNNDDGRQKPDKNGYVELQVKPEFLRDHRPSSLGDLPPDLVAAATGDRRDDGRSSRGNKKKQYKKKRPRDVRVSNSEKVCLAVIRGDKCPWGDTCKFSHDLPLFMKTRPEDLTSLPEGCPTFAKHGYCLFGALCRFGSCHIIKATGENVKKDLPADATAAEEVKNNLPKDTVLKLRKRNYPFRTKRNESKNKPNSKGKNPRPEEEKGAEKDASQENGTAEVKMEANTVTAANDAKSVDMEAIKTEDEPKDKEETAAGIHFKDIADPFRPSTASSQYNDSTPLPSKTKKLIDFSGKVYVAPLTTVGNLPFRRVLKGYGADITCGEMAVANNLLDGKPSEWALLKRHPSEDVFGVQIAGGYADQCARVCEVIENHMEVDFVDINCGCPLDIICNKGAGSSLMMRDRRLKSILQEVTPILSCPVTVKMRTGWDTKKPFAHELVSKIQSWGIDGVAAVMVRCIFVAFISYFLFPVEYNDSACSYLIPCRSMDDHDYSATPISRIGTTLPKSRRVRATTYPNFP